MNSRTIPSYLIIKLFILITTQQSSSNPTGIYGTCNSPFTCGAISGVRYPFRRHQDPLYCGYPGFDLNCDDKNPPSINIMNTTYQILDIDPTAQTLRIVREDMIESTCPRDLVNVTIDRSLFEYPSSYMNISFLFGCPFSLTYPTVLGSIFCDNNGVEPVFLLPGNLGPGVCKTSVVVPVPVGFVNSTPLTKFLQDGFEVRWKVDGAGCTGCTRSRGQCVYNYDTGRTMCTCPESANLTDTCTRANLTRAGSTLSSSSSGNSKNKSLSIILPIIGAVLAVVGITWAIFVCRQRRKRGASKAAAVAQTESKAILTTVSSKRLSSNTQSNFTTSIPSYPSSKSSKDYGKSSYFGAQVFTYEELEVATNNFNGSRELGDGGFGTVYYGKLLDGREVAVKRLYENNFKRVEQFMNEVEILTRLHHENLVKLYGCTSKRSRELLLVYEYIPNGTVADHLHGKLANPTSGLFTWSVRLNIAIETANALAYLHQSDIIHRDVKTNNILLDKSFRVKVADFGLSRLFPNDATHVSTAPQGTPGYVDPEYYQCYQLTDKSDVYSFGVVLVELISSLQAVDTNRDRLDINLATLAMTKIQNHMLDELVDKRMGFETDGFVRRMMTLVAGLAFRCLQQEKDMRPTMKEVVEVLRGIKDEELNVKKAEVVDIVVDDGGLLTGGVKEPPSPDSGVTDRLVEGSVPNSSDG